jgi:hypothetical protein
MIGRPTENALDLESLVVGQTESSMHDHPRTLANALAGMAHRREVLARSLQPAKETITWRVSNPFP